MKASYCIESRGSGFDLSTMIKCCSSSTCGLDLCVGVASHARMRSEGIGCARAPHDTPLSRIALPLRSF